MENNAALNLVLNLVGRFGKQLRYLASSLTSTGVDYVVLLTLNAILGGVFIPLVVARIASCTVNFLINRSVFANKENIAKTAMRYALVSTSVMMLSYLSITALTNIGLAVWVATILANGSLFIVTYTGQRFFVFGSPADLRALVADRVARTNYALAA